MPIAFPNESPEYRAARLALLEQEKELRRATEAVAEQRRALPPGGAVPEDYVFEEMGPNGKVREVRLSALFAPGRDSLVIYNFMFPRHAHDTRDRAASGPASRWRIEDNPCPSCTALLDQLDGASEHFGQNANLVIVAGTSPERLAAFAQHRGWRHLRLVSAAKNRFKQDYHADQDGSQQPMLTVFHRDGDTIRHSWSSELLYEEPEPGQDPRHVGPLEPLWNLFDFTPEGRPMAWNEQLQY
jgi:predicted dithiol-disulfide oxidoreductase (DUF899 family)